MNRRSIGTLELRGLAAIGVALVVTVAAVAAEPNSEVVKWLGKEVTVESSSVAELIPIGGKLTFVYDSEDDVIRVCTRTAATQKGAWKMDMAPGCNVALTFTRGTRYCTIEDVKAGNAEVLSACHRLRSHDVALQPAPVKGTVELNDVIVFPVEDPVGKVAIAILIDSPSRVTDGGVVIAKS